MLRDSLKIVTQIIVLTGIVYGQAAVGQSLERLLDAVEQGNAPEVTRYLDQGLDANTTGPQGQTILMAASRLGHMEVVRLLLARKANPNREAPTGDTAVMLASLGGHLQVVRLLAENGAQVSRKGWTALHYAAYGGSADIVRFLLDKGADKDGVAPNWDTPLLLAVRGGHLAAARELLLSNPDLAHRSQKGETALGVAKARDQSQMVELLVRAGARE